MDSMKCVILLWITICQIAPAICCSLGYHLVNETCTRCPFNTYKDYEGQGHCIDCPRDENGIQSQTQKYPATNITDCFFKPYIVNFSPKYGPIRGGTKVRFHTAYLEDMAIDNFFIRVGRHVVATELITRLSDNLLQVVTPAVDSVQNVTINILISTPDNEHTLHVNEQFQYLPNPRLFTVHNPKTIVSGGVSLDVTGENLAVIQHMSMVVYRTYHNETQLFTSACEVANNTHMTCYTPDLTVGIEEVIPPVPILDEWDTSKALYIQPGTVRQRRDADPGSMNNEDLTFDMGFEMDGVQSENATKLPVYFDPVVYRFENPVFTEMFFTKNIFLDIKGERLNYGLELRDLSVRIGVGNCEVTLFATNTITCRPPDEEPEPYLIHGPDHTPAVIVHMGRRLKFVVGYLRFIHPGDIRMFYLFMAMGGIACLLIVTVCFVSVWCVYYRRRRKEMGSKDDLEMNDVSQFTVDDEAVTYLEPARKHEKGSRNGMIIHSTREHSNGTVSNGTIANGTVSNGTISNASVGNGTVSTGEISYAILDSQTSEVASDTLYDQVLHQKIQECLIESERLSIGDTIGKGRFGTVSIGKFADDSNQNFYDVAIKSMKDNIDMDMDEYNQEMENFLDEGLIMMKFNHKNILSVHGVAVIEQLPYIVLEYMDLGDVKQFVSSTDRTFTGAELLHIAAQVAEGMQYLSSQNFIHRDLAARNCMINSSLVVKIADFGLSRDLYSSYYYKSEQKGRPLPIKWMAPESLNAGRYGVFSDVWSFGVFLWEVLSLGASPYADVDNFNIKEYINRGHRLDKPEDCPQDVYALMLKCWENNPDDRPTFPQILSTLTEVLNTNTDIQKHKYIQVFES